MTRGQQIALYWLTPIGFACGYVDPWLLFPFFVSVMIAWDRL